MFTVCAKLLLYQKSEQLEMLWLFIEPFYYIWAFQSTQSMNFKLVTVKYKTLKVNNFFSIVLKTHTVTMDQKIPCESEHFGENQNSGMQEKHSENFFDFIKYYFQDGCFFRTVKIIQYLIKKFTLYPHELHVKHNNPCQHMNFRLLKL